MSKPLHYGQAWLIISSSVLNPDNPLGAICYDFPASVRPELVEGFVLQRKWFDKLTTNGLMDYLG
jgi:hypothetical protein